VITKRNTVLRTNGSLDAGGGGADPRIPPLTQAIAGEDSIPVFNVSAKVATDLLASTGKKAADLQTAIDSNLKSVSTPVGRRASRVTGGHSRAEARALV
jgi:hypothetical protein